MSFIIIMNSCPDQKVANHIAESLVDANLAACVHIMPAGSSVYRWQGKVESASEHLLLIKTHGSKFSLAKTMIQTLHPYELPEIVAVPISNGSSDYLGWLGENLDL